jgi:hypothetical protein
MTASTGKLLYVGPVNALVARMKAFSVASSAAATAAAPALIHYSPVTEVWTHTAKLGLLGGGMQGEETLLPRFHSIQHSVVLATSYATTWLFHRLIKKYVYSVRLAADPGNSCDKPRLALETPSLLGRRRHDQVPIQDLCRGDSVFCTWKRQTSSGGYLIQFVPKAERSLDRHQPHSLSLPKTFRNEPIDWDTFESIFSDIASRR